MSMMWWSHERDPSTDASRVLVDVYTILNVESRTEQVSKLLTTTIPSVGVSRVRSRFTNTLPMAWQERIRTYTASTINRKINRKHTSRFFGSYRHYMATFVRFDLFTTRSGYIPMGPASSLQSIEEHEKRERSPSSQYLDPPGAGRIASPARCQGGRTRSLPML